jgi:membrane-associated phospholipid phosphatase
MMRWLLLLLWGWALLPACAGEGWARFASTTGTALYLGAGTLLPLATDGGDGGRHAARAADALAGAVLLSEGLKRLVPEARPDGSDRKSFPSMHTASAMAVATVQSRYHPEQSTAWYAGAAVVGFSRVALRKHHPHDVLAGAALGHAIARLSLQQSRGFLLTPLIPDAPGAAFAPEPLLTVRGVGLSPLMTAEGMGVQAGWAF